VTFRESAITPISIPQNDATLTPATARVIETYSSRFWRSSLTFRPARDGPCPPLPPPLLDDRGLTSIDFEWFGSLIVHLSRREKTVSRAHGAAPPEIPGGATRLLWPAHRLRARLTY